MVTAKAREIYERAAKERQAHGETAPGRTLIENLPQALQGTARDQAGKALGVSGKTVDHATKVLREGEPELVKAVEEGRMAARPATILK